MELVGDNALVVAPTTAECPICKTFCKRHSIRGRKVRDIDLDGQRVVLIRVGVYSCPNCKKHFRLQTGLAEKGKHYSKRALNKSFMAVRDDKTTFTALPSRLSRDFHIQPSKSTCHRWFHERADGIDFSRDFEPEAVKSFSGALAIDEVYDKEFCLFFATDPLNRRPVSFHLCRAGNGEELRIFLTHLRDIGITPEALIVDGSTLYTSIPQEIWPSVRIQLCNFHAIRNCQEDIENAIRAFYRTLAKSSRCLHENFQPPDWWTQQMEKKVSDRNLIRKYGTAFLTRDENLSVDQQKVLKYLCDRFPELQTLRDFQKQLLALFQKEQTIDEAWTKLRAMRENTQFEEFPHLQLALKRLANKKFEKMITFLDYENLDATTNHVERTNRWFRKRQKTHYRNRKERTITNMLKADLIGRSGNPGKPIRLMRRRKADTTAVA